MGNRKMEAPNLIRLQAIAPLNLGSLASQPARIYSTTCRKNNQKESQRPILNSSNRNRLLPRPAFADSLPTLAARTPEGNAPVHRGVELIGRRDELLGDLGIRHRVSLI